MKKILISICLGSLLFLSGCKEDNFQIQEYYLIKSEEQTVVLTKTYVFVLKGDYHGLSAGESVNLNTGKVFKFDLDALLETYPKLKDVL